MTAGGTRPFDHFLLTRFSAVLNPAAPPVGEDWLAYRLGFFFDACLPSVTHQQGADFTWLVLFDDRCSDEFRDQVEQLAKGAFTPIWTHEPFRRDSFASHVAARSEAPFVITTRIDSDDAMAVDFMAAVQEQFANQERLFINFPGGIQIDRSGGVYRTKIVSSPFLSLIERRRPGRPPATVYVAKHARARGYGPLLQVKAPAMWAQIVHDTNVSNILNGLQTHPRVVGRRFDFDLAYDHELGGLRLRRAQLRQVLRLVRLWASHPGELTKWAEAQAWTAHGTHLWPQNSGDSATDRLRWTTRRVRVRVQEARWALKERINRIAAPGVRVVSGDLQRLLAGDRVVVMAEWSRGRRIREDALRVASAYAAAGWPTLVVAAREPWVRLARHKLPAGVVVAQRGNSAYDFGTWRDALRAFPDLAGKDRVVLTNDSLVGPIGPVDDLLRRIAASNAQVWAATTNNRPTPHLQSFLLAFCGGVLADERLRDFFANVVPQPSKTQVVRTYEFGLTRLINDLGLTTEVGWRHQDLGLPPEANPVAAGWEALLDSGFPFVKRTLLTERGFAALRPAIEERLRRASRP